MRLILADLHLLNEANDRYHKVIPNIHEALNQFDLLNKIDSVDLIGDIVDCEYVTFKRITYFSFIMDLITDQFAESKRVLIGNHDKYFKNDQHNENIIRYLKFDGDIIDAPTILDRILYIPHYYNHENFPAGLVDPNDFDIIIGHLGLEFVNGMEELTVEKVNKIYKNKPIISGHIHNMDLNFEKNIFLLGSLKSETYKEQSPVYSACVLDGKTPYFIVFPYHKIHLTVEVREDNSYRDELIDIFKRVHKHNMNYCLYNKDGDIINQVPCDKYLTSMINLKFKIFNKNIKKSDIDIVLEYCRHEVDDPAFMSINIKTMYQIENGESEDGVAIYQPEKKIDKSQLEEQKKKIFSMVEDIKSGRKLDRLSQNKKFSKILDAVSDGEVERFAEFLLSCEKASEFEELIHMIN